MTVQQAFVSEVFHPDDTIREVWADLMGRAYKKAKVMGGVFAEPGHWNIQPPLEDDDDCYHVRLQFAVTMPDPPESSEFPPWWPCDGYGPVCRSHGHVRDESNVVRGDE